MCLCVCVCVSVSVSLSLSLRGLLFSVNYWCLASCMAILYRVIILNWMFWVVKERDWRERKREKEKEREGERGRGREREREGERKRERATYYITLLF